MCRFVRWRANWRQRVHDRFFDDSRLAYGRQNRAVAASRQTNDDSSHTGRANVESDYERYRSRTDAGKSRGSRGANIIKTDDNTNTDDDNEYSPIRAVPNDY